MNWKKCFPFILIITITLLIPFNLVNAEKKDEKEVKSPDEIIEREDVDKEDIPDPPEKDEALLGEEGDLSEIEIETPSSVTGEKAEGSGTVVDFSTTGARAFYTIEDNDNNTFHLIIDMDKADNNVYFLSDVNQENLSGNADTSSSNSPADILGGNEDEKESEDEDATEVSGSKEDNEKNESSNLGFLMVVLLVALAGAVAYYFFVIKKKQTKNTVNEDEDEDEEMLEIYEDNDLYSDDEINEEESSEEDKE